MAKSNIQYEAKPIADLCGRLQIKELCLFGSVLREDFRPESDIDVLVSFRETASASAYDFPAIEHELGDLFGRAVDLVEKEGLRNPFRKYNILNSRQIVYVD